ncbi:MAG: universal stress protein [Longimicrobiales bacterium]
MTGSTADARTDECPEPHRLLVAVDESENSRRAVEYVGRWVACYEAARVMLAHVVKEPSEDVLPDRDERESQVRRARDAAEQLLADIRATLEDEGVEAERIATKVLSCRPPDTVVDALLAEKDSGDYDTIVVGRRGASKKEEYIFGSVTMGLIREVSTISVWVVE